MHRGKRCYFFTIVVSNTTTNKGLPAAFFITSDESSYALTKWLRWLNVNNKLSENKIMIDCRIIQPHEGKIIDLLSALTRLYTYVVADLGSNNNIPTYYLTPSYLLSLPKVDTPISVEVVVELYPRGSGSSSAENTCTTSAT
ncbi:uncharacterized protein EV154DRAFT_569937 [Mucor mucedo]|uniref:uncharacterized protein n=1 Tax=Mucor mucedo TaxID=29922 RepID=UPI002220DAF2|nr:uncharacterized protein EV154DRAFT_569937 [Mucor mucedo]KAI7873758.1 hypothetical protein EV154DRAFT_569937 [Mucor mucedo]